MTFNKHYFMYVTWKSSYSSFIVYDSISKQFPGFVPLVLLFANVIRQ